jgi:hypothetical protein
MTLYLTMLVAIIPGWKLNRLESKSGCFFEQTAKVPFAGLSGALQIILAETDDCRLVAFNPGSVAINPG